MRLVVIDGVWVNPDAVCIVREADSNELGFQTELMTEGGVQLLKTKPSDVALFLTRDEP